MALAPTYTYQPEKITVAHGRPLWTFHFRQSPETEEALRTLAETIVPENQIAALWEQAFVDMTTTVARGGWVTFRRMDGANDTSLTMTMKNLRNWCVEMLRIYRSVRPEPTPDEAELTLAQAMTTWPAQSTVRDYQGLEYQVLYQALDHTGRVDMVYRSLDDDRIYTRPVSQWDDQMPVGGSTVPRFTRL